MFGKEVNQITLYFVDGYLVKKKYTFEEDLFHNSNLKIVSGKKPDFDQTTAVLTFRYKGRKFRYGRGSLFYLIEEL